MPAAAETTVLDGLLDAGERAALHAVVLRILPSLEGAGAAEAGCPEYVERVVETRLAAPIRARVRRGLAFADGLARQMCGKAFADASDDERDAVLRQLQLIPHPTLQDFIHRMVNMTLEGFLCHPGHGGNRGEAGWRSLGIGAARTTVRDRGCTTS